MNISDYTAFTVLAKELNFTKAAARLYVSTQALSKRIINLEKYYGVTLFNRQPQVTLTHAGERLLQYYNDVAILESKAKDEMADIANHNLGQIRIGISPVRSTSKLSEIFTRFHEAYPSIQIIVDSKPLKFLFKELLDHALDMVISVSTADVPEAQYVVISKECSHVHISDACLKKYCPENYSALVMAERSLTPLSIKSFVHCPFFLPAPETKEREKIDAALNSHHVSLKPSVITNSREMRMELVRDGAGATIINSQIRYAFEQRPGDDAHTAIHAFRLLEMPNITEVKLSYMVDKYIPKYGFDLIEMISKNYE